MIWPFGGRTRLGALPEPAPEIVMAANGVYWRRYADTVSMVPVSDDNDPLLTPVAVYRLAGWEDHEGTFHAVASTGEQSCSTCKGDMVVPDPDNPVVGNPCPDCTVAPTSRKDRPDA